MTHREKTRCELSSKEMRNVCVCEIIRNNKENMNYLTALFQVRRYILNDGYAKTKPDETIV